MTMDLNTQIALMAATLLAARGKHPEAINEQEMNAAIRVAKHLWLRVIALERED